MTLEITIMLVRQIGWQFTPLVIRYVAKRLLDKTQPTQIIA